MSGPSGAAVAQTSAPSAAAASVAAPAARTLWSDEAPVPPSPLSASAAAGNASQGAAATGVGRAAAAELTAKVASLYVAAPGEASAASMHADGEAADAVHQWTGDVVVEQSDPNSPLYSVGRFEDLNLCAAPVPARAIALGR